MADAGYAAVELESVTIRTPERKVLLDDVNWRVLPSERWVVLGPNGAGKTTMLAVVGAGWRRNRWRSC